MYKKWNWETEKNALQVNLGHFITTRATTKALKHKLVAAGTCWVIKDWTFWYYSCYCKNCVSSGSRHRENMSYETFFLSRCRTRSSGLFKKLKRKSVCPQSEKNPTPSRLKKDLNVILEEARCFYAACRQDAETWVWKGRNSSFFFCCVFVVEEKREKNDWGDSRLLVLASG